MPHFFTSLRLRLILVVFLAVLPALGLIVYTGFEQRLHAAADAQNDALRVVRLASGDQKRLVQETHHLLIALAERTSVENRDPVACSQLFADLLQKNRHYLNLGLIEPGGNLLCSALSFTGQVQLGDRAYFQRVLETRDFAAGGFQIGRVSGRAMVNFGYPVLDATAV
jgi:hypothetical protein